MSSNSNTRNAKPTVAVHISQKGGVGKSTTALLAAEAISRRGFKVLLIDLDPLATLSDTALAKYGKTLVSTVSDWLAVPGLQAAGLSTRLTADLDILPTGDELENLLNDLAADPSRVTELRDAIEENCRYFDVVIIDAVPSLSALSWAAIVAADLVVVPTLLDKASIKGLKKVIGQIEAVRENLRLAPMLIGAIANMADLRNSREREALEALQTGEGMPPLLGTLPARRGRRAWEQLTEAFKPIATEMVQAILRAEKAAEKAGKGERVAA